LLARRRAKALLITEEVGENDMVLSVRKLLWNIEGHEDVTMELSTIQKATRDHIAPVARHAFMAYTRMVLTRGGCRATPTAFTPAAH